MVNTLIQFIVEPVQIHWIAVNNVLQYLKGTIHIGLRSVGDDELMLHGLLILTW